MSRYTNMKLNVSKNEKAKIKNALQTDGPIAIKFDFKGLCGEDIFSVTKKQLNKITKGYENNKGVSLKLTEAQIKQKLKVEGGFLGMLASHATRALPFLAKTVAPALVKGSLAGLASTGVSKMGGKVC